MPSLVTVYNCGTMFDETSNDVIAELARLTYGQRGSDWEINPGPGSLGMVNRDAPSYQNAVNTLSRVTGPAGILTGLLSEPISRGIATVGGAGAGLGMDVSARHVVEFVERSGATTVNMAGWSRGAVTCILAANLLGLRSQAVRVNMFLFDPVDMAPMNDGGVGSIGSNVVQATVIQQMDSSDILMQAHNPFGNAARNHALATTILTMPGEHSSSVLDPGQSNPYRDAYFIGRSLCAEFLLDHGTVLRIGNRKTGVEYLEHYSGLWLALNAGRAHQRSWVTGVNARGDMNFGNRLLGSRFFNSHHLTVFRDVLPKTALALAYVLTTQTRLHPDVAGAALLEIDLVQQRTDIPKTLDFVNRQRWWITAFAEGRAPEAAGSGSR